MSTDYTALYPRRENSSDDSSQHHHIFHFPRSPLIADTNILLRKLIIEGDFGLNIILALHGIKIYKMNKML
jgi:hypothetical protein